MHKLYMLKNSKPYLVSLLLINLLPLPVALANTDLTQGEVVHGAIIQGEATALAGRYQDRQGVSLEAAEAQWQLPSATPGQPVSVQFWVRPMDWSGLSPERVTVAKLKIGDSEWVVSKASERAVLILTRDGTVFGEMPIHTWGDDRWIITRGIHSARWHHLAFEINADTLLWSVDGFVAGEADIAGLPKEDLVLVLGSDKATGYADLIIAQRSLGRGEALRQTFRNSYTWEPAFPKTTVTIPYRQDFPGEIEEIGAWLRENGTQLPVMKRRGRGAVTNWVLGDPIKAYMAYNSHAIYMVIDTPFSGEADVRYWPSRNVGNIPGEGYEIFILPPWTGVPDYVQLAGNPLGNQIDLRNMNADWTGEWEWEASMGDGIWEGLLVAPFDGLDLPHPEDGAVWTMNFYNGQAGSAWSWVPHSYHDTQRFGDLRFEKDPPLFRMGYPEVTDHSVKVPLEIFGTTRDVPLQVRMAFYSEGDILPTGETVMNYVLGKGKSWSPDLSFEDLPAAEGMVSLSVHHEGTLIFGQAFRIPAHSPNIRRVRYRRDQGEVEAASATVEEVAEERDPRYRTEWTPEEIGEFVLSINEWQGNRLGFSDVVPSPWIPVTEDGDKVTVWNRSYKLGGHLFPGSILSAGQELLSGPIQIVIGTGAGKIDFSEAQTRFEQENETRVDVHARARQGGLEVRTHHEVEFDGMIRTEVRIMSDDPNATYEGLYLEIPLRSEMVEGYHYIGRSGHPPITNAGEVSEEGFVLDSFRCLVWLGTMDAGFTWFSESMKNWPLWNEDAIIALGPDEGGTRLLRIKLGDRPFRLSAPLRLVFGFQATPLRPQPDNFRWLSDSRLPMEWRWFRGDGTYILWHDFPEKPREEILRFREQGREVMPISSLRYYGRHYFDRNSFYELPTPGLVRPEIYLWSDIWSHIDGSQVPAKSLPSLGASQVASGTDWHGERFQPQGLINLCPNSSFQDFFIWKLHTLIEETDLGSIYLDQPAIYCSNPYHKCGYVDYKGEWRHSVALFAMRDMMRRIYQLYYDKHGRTMIRWHSSNQLIVPCLSFIDIKWDGENYTGGILTVQEFYSDLLAPDRMRFQHSGKPFGFAPDLLPLITRDRAPTPASARDVSGYFMVHDSTVHPQRIPHRDLARHIQHQRQRFPFGDGEAIYYWQEDPRISVDDPDVLYIAHPAPGQTLLVLFNHSDMPISTNLSLDLAGLGFDEPENLVLEDFYYDHPLGKVEETLRIEVAPRDFRMLRIYDTDVDT